MLKLRIAQSFEPHLPFGLIYAYLDIFRYIWDKNQGPEALTRFSKPLGLNCSHVLGSILSCYPNQFLSR